MWVVYLEALYKPFSTDTEFVVFVKDSEQVHHPDTHGAHVAD